MQVATRFRRLLGHRPARTAAALGKANRAPIVSGLELARALAQAGRVGALVEARVGPGMAAAVRAAAHRDAALVLVAPPLPADVRGPGASARADAAWLQAAAAAADLCGLGAPLALFGSAEGEERAYALLEAGYTGIACRAREAAAAAECLRPARESEMGTLYRPEAGEGGVDAVSGLLVEMARAGVLPDWVAVPPGEAWIDAVRPALPVVRFDPKAPGAPPRLEAGAFDLGEIGAEGPLDEERQEALAWAACCDALDAVGASRCGHEVGEALLELWAE